MKRSFIVTLAVLLLAAGIVAVVFVGCRGGTESIATVEGADISQEDFFQHMKTKATVRVVLNTGQVVELRLADTMAFQALQDLISQKVMLQMAEDEGLLPSKDRVKEEIKFRVRLNPNFVTNLVARGYTISQIRREVTVDLAREALLTRGIEVTIEEIDTLIEENPERFMEQATIDMFYILANSEETKENVDAALAAAEPFKAVAAKFSEAPNAARTQGRFPERRLNSLSTVIRDLVQNTAVNGTTDWLEIEQSGVKQWAKFLIEGRTDAQPIDMNDDLREQYRRQRAMEYGLMANDLNLRVGERLKNAEIEISDDEDSLQTQYKRYQERLLESDLRTTGGGTSTSDDSDDTDDAGSAEDSDGSDD